MELLFLAWRIPWPAFGGGRLRTLGLLKELAKDYPVRFMALYQKEPSAEQKAELGKTVDSIALTPMAGSTPGDRLRVLAHMLHHRMPYHCARVDLSFRRAPDLLQQVRSFPGIVYASFGHWGTLIRGQPAPNWILDQHNADVDFWRVYATQATGWWRKLAAWINWRLAAAHFPGIYSSVGRVIAVCEADRQLTLDIAPQTPVDVIENGVDCTYYVPHRQPRSGPPRLLFTGTSAPRNVTALRQFTRDVWPLVKRDRPDAELLVAGNFKPEAQAEFADCADVQFTGWVEDIRPYFDQSDLFISPFEETHGSKLKIAEAMAMAMPIVSTPEGARGFPLVDGESVLIARDDEQFAAQIVDLLADPPRLERMGAAARQVALATVDWAVLGERLRGIVEQTAASLSRQTEGERQP